MSEEINKANSGEQEDSVLVKAFLALDSGAFDTLVLKYKDKVFNLCYRMLSDYEEANDCAQETFVKVYRGLKNFRFESSFSTWLFRITVNTCKNKQASTKYRQSKAMIRIDAFRESENGSVYTVEIADEKLSPVIELERKEKQARIQKAIDTLPDEQKTVVVLRDVEGLSYEEIAQITGYNLGTVKSKLARARESLRERLQGVI